MVVRTDASTTTPLWKFAFGFIPVGGIVLPLIPLGFGVGLTFPVYLLAAQNQVRMADVGEAGGLIQFLQSLGGAVGLSVLGSFQATKFASLDPPPSAACSSQAPPMPLCGGDLGSLEGSLIKSYDQTFFVMLGLLAVAFLFALFLKGRLPKGQPPITIPEAGVAEEAVSGEAPPAHSEPVAPSPVPASQAGVEVPHRDRLDSG